MFFEDFLRLRALKEPKMVPYGRVVDNALIRDAFSAVVFPVRAWHVIVVSIGLTLWSVQMPPQLRAILAQIFRYQN